MPTKIKLFTVTWSTDTAGVSPHDNMRTELFFKGCNKAISGNACLGCFNQPLWDDYAKYTHSVESVAEQVIRHAPNKYATIGGGEPTDQIEGLIELTQRLKQAGFHIMVYTWKDLYSVLHNHTGERREFLQLLQNIDMLVDGIYDPRERVYRKSQGDGFLNSVGSGNQTVWDVRDYRENGHTLLGFKMRDLCGMQLKLNDDLIYITDGEKEPLQLTVSQKGVA
ncbi:4Fe-4S cluster-binding domain-containing protein [Bacillus spizizenii]|nr:radical SAM protein [Bacillus spizizenii]MCY8890438.1 radical SAM protein [Bacillus spizizenii]MEC0841893.1 4Fe-4S cluster-binding domain-containing protein [Bacillus spizizenii]